MLRDLSLEVAQGQSLAVVGPSGCGKSTLLNIMGTLDRPTFGQVLLEDRDLSTLNDGQLAAVRNQQIGWVFQLHHLLPQLTVLENVLVPTLAGNHKHDTGTSAPDRASELLKRVGLADRLNHRPGQLSGGERQRVGRGAGVNQSAAPAPGRRTGPGLWIATLPRHWPTCLAELNHDQGVALVVVDPLDSPWLSAWAGYWNYAMDAWRAKGLGPSFRTPTPRARALDPTPH